MADHDRRAPDTVAARLYREPHAFEFAQAVMLLERMRPDAIPLGRGMDPRAEAVRLRGPLAPLFAPSALTRLEQPEQEPLPVLTAELFGLGGPDGPLPYAYQEWLAQRRRSKDQGPGEFLDLFQHRLLSLLYRAQTKYRLAPSFAPAEQSPARPLLRALLGLLPVPLQERQGVPDAALLARTALFANQRRSVAGFQALLHHHLGVQAKVSPFEGAWRLIPTASLTKIGPLGRNSSLGQGAVVGNRVWDEHAGIRVTLGPLSFGLYLQYLPGGEQHRTLMALAGFYFGPDLDCTLVLLLAEGEAPPAELADQAPPQLGRTSWLGRPGTTLSRTQKEKGR
ncbi:type VI secretion system baseplate subunit TssG [Gallaecimonas kandeliae]|uniref:type VI secretion system baseplate subunit TssG n=1 Tax=Gallaecimonas kandeliae TaxID=3029055 RepID=UPI002647A253|nr:type VI secretion system baseplate subunit TssG [Gallaecimonas kandeliae]WKE64484.1 type VI secretion system baseplate subunit TssG [Gallaecimonas kandeliae]